MACFGSRTEGDARLPITGVIAKSPGYAKCEIPKEPQCPPDLHGNRRSTEILEQAPRGCPEMPMDSAPGVSGFLGERSQQTARTSFQGLRGAARTSPSPRRTHDELDRKSVV